MTVKKDKMRFSDGALRGLEFKLKVRKKKRK